jgi:hypothetical protein
MARDASMKCKRICLFLLFILYCLSNPVGEIQQAIAGQNHWKTLLGYNNWNDGNPVVMKIANGYFIAGISSYMAGKNYQRKVILWKLGDTGREIWAKDINLPSWQTGNPFTAGRCFSLRDEPTLLLVNSSSNRAYLLKFDNSGSVIFSKEFLGKQVFDVQGLVKTNDGLFLYGGNGGDACVTKMTFAGNEIWHREYDNGKTELGMGLAPLKDGSFILSADSGKYNKFGGGPSETLIIKCNRNGGIENKATFEGRHPSVVVNGDVTAVVFNKEDFLQQDISVVGLDAQFKTIWKIDSLFGKTAGIGMMATIVNKEGYFVLGGQKSMMPMAASIWEISKKGDILAEIGVEDANRCVRFDSLLQTQSGYLVAGSISKMPEMPRTPDGQQDKEVQRDTEDILVAEVADLTK